MHELELDPPIAQLNWTNANGGPLTQNGDPAERFFRHTAPSAPHAMIEPSLHHMRPGTAQPETSAATPRFKYVQYHGFLAAGNDLQVVNVTSVQDALEACTRLIECRGLCYRGGPNGTMPQRSTTVYLKRLAIGCAGSHCKALPWTSWIKSARVDSPAATFSASSGLTLALRQGSYTVQWLNVSRPNVTNLSFVPPLTPQSALPLVQHLGDITLRLRHSSSSSSSPSGWHTFASAWGPFTAEALPLRPAAGQIAAHDITPLLDASSAIYRRSAANAEAADSPHRRCPVRVLRAYLEGSAGDVGISFTLTNEAAAPVEMGGLGMSVPSAVSQDVHIGGAHGWVEWSRVHIAEKTLQVDQQCVLATPLNAWSKLENWRPIFEFGGGGYEWSVRTKAWAEEWERNVQWPFLYMAEQLNATGLWPHPRSPWPSWADGGATVRTNFTRQTHWNPPSSLTLAPGESVTVGMRLSACPGGPRTRDDALARAGEPVLFGVPGYTLATDMRLAVLYVMMPRGLGVASAVSSSNAVLSVIGSPKRANGTWWYVMVKPVARGRARITVKMADGSSAVAHYIVLPPLPEQIDRVARHWSEVAWLTRKSTDPFGRGASVMPYDREDGRRRFDDGRAYDVGLSDDAGAANNLGLATSQAFRPSQSSVSRLDEYVTYTLYGIKPDTAKAPFKSLQLPDPDNGIRMTLYYYNQTYFPYKYTEAAECGTVGGLNFNWCMTEKQANATYRGFNVRRPAIELKSPWQRSAPAFSRHEFDLSLEQYPHQIVVWYALYRAARNHGRLRLEHGWEWYLERAANTTIRLGWARIGYMDGTVAREVLRSLLEEAEEAEEAGLSGRWAALGQVIEAGERKRAEFFASAANPYGSEFSYDTTGQEEVCKSRNFGLECPASN